MSSPNRQPKSRSRSHNARRSKTRKSTAVANTPKATARGSGEENRYNLRHRPPPDVRHAVRQACGFGCVLCGKALVHYDHFDPEFKDAREHKAEGIALLCGGHHDEKTRGWITNEQVAEGRRNPPALQAGFAHKELRIGADRIAVFFGSNRVNGNGVLLRVRGQDLIAIKPPEAPGAPYRLSAVFHDRKGKLLCQIVENEYVIRSDLWDANIEGATLEIRHAKRDIALSITMLPGVGVRINRIDTFYAGKPVKVEPKSGALQMGQAIFTDCVIGEEDDLPGSVVVCLE